MTMHGRGGQVGHLKVDGHRRGWRFLVGRKRGEYPLPPEVWQNTTRREKQQIHQMLQHLKAVFWLCTDTPERPVTGESETSPESVKVTFSQPGHLSWSPAERNILLQLSLAWIRSFFE